jgi:formate-dependent nitrite reductase cytochrome c552 subunit
MREQHDGWIASSHRRWPSATTVTPRTPQFYLDFVEAENSTGFHAPQEAARVLGESIDFTRRGQVAVREPTRR